MQSSSVATGIQREVLTNDRGLYVVILLPAGTYDLLIDADRFQPASIQAVEVTLGAVVTVNVQIMPPESRRRSRLRAARPPSS